MTFSIGIANTFVYKHDKKQSFVTYRKKKLKKGSFDDVLGDSSDWVLHFIHYEITVRVTCL